MNPTITSYLTMVFELLYGIGYAWAIHHFCISHFTCINQRKKPILFLLAISIPVCDTIIYSGILPYPVWLLLPLLWNILTIFWIILLYHGETVQKIFAAALLLTVSSLMANFAESFPMCLILIILRAMHIERTPLIDYILAYMIYCTATAYTIWGIALLTKHTTGFFVNRFHRWYIMLSTPLFGIVILWYLIYVGACHGILLRGGDYLNLTYNEILSHIGISVLSLLCMCGAGFYVFGMDKIDIEQKQKEQYHSQVTFYQMLEEQYRSLEQVRHDMKNHIIGLQCLIDNLGCNKKSDEFDCEICLQQTRNYLHKLATTGGIEYADELTGKSIIDAMLYYKHNQAREDHIQWECDAHIPPECPIDDFDLCVIFGNLLDNALEACQKIPIESDRFINIQAHLVKKCLLIEIINSAEIKTIPAIEIKTPENVNHYIGSNSRVKHPIYIKHGIGLRNVKDAIAKYNGTMSINTNDNIFRVSILLPCVSPVHDINQSL